MVIPDPLPVAISGVRGRMGRMVREAVLASPDLALVAETDQGDDLAAALRSSGATVLVDFTTPEVGADHLDLALELGVHPVVGTTGIPRARLDDAVARARATGTGGVVAPNFALGAVLMMELSRRAAPHLPRIEIIESHHPAKLDAPSGTSLSTRERLLRATGGARPIPIHSVRLPGFVATQEVILGGTGERLVIRHDTIDRSCFAPGILLAVRRAPRLGALLLDLAPLLFPEESSDSGEDPAD